MTNETLIQTYYSGWDKREWSLVDSLLADSFTFTSANDDDHIGSRGQRPGTYRRLPLNQDAGGSGVTQGGPLGASQASPYVWQDEQRDRGRREDERGRGLRGGFIDGAFTEVD